MAHKVSGSRIGRLATLGWLSRRALPIAWERLRQASEAAPEERGALAEEALRRHADVAEEAFRTLGTMKGLALKLGQTLSYMDGALPERYRGVYQEVLSRLQQDAPTLPWSAIEPILVEDLGRPVAAAFYSFEPEPFAAASIGQVHRATLPGGREVAVKVQYPGIAAAITADMKNASLLRSFATPLLGLSGRAGMVANMKDVLREIQARVLDELDYEREARMQRRFAEMFAGDPDILVPEVIPACSGRRVLTSEFVHGAPFAEICATASQEHRDRYAAVLTRAMFSSMYEHALFNADPHPGNYLFPSDGRVALLDFGCVKELSASLIASMKRYVRAAIVATRTDDPADWSEFDRAITAVFHLDPADERAYGFYRELILYCLRPYLRDEPFEFTPAYTGASIDLLIDAKKALVFGEGLLPRIPNLPQMPADFTFISRLQWGFYSVLTMLRANGNWHRMMLPELRGDGPL